MVLLKLSKNWWYYWFTRLRWRRFSIFLLHLRSRNCKHSKQTLLTKTDGLGISCPKHLIQLWTRWLQVRLINSNISGRSHIIEEPGCSSLAHLDLKMFTQTKNWRTEQFHFVKTKNLILIRSRKNTFRECATHNIASRFITIWVDRRTAALLWSP